MNTDTFKCQDTDTGFVNTMRTSSGFIKQLLMGIMIDINWENRGGDDYDSDDPIQEIILLLITILHFHFVQYH